MIGVFFNFLFYNKKINSLSIMIYKYYTWAVHIPSILAIMDVASLNAKINLFLH